MPRVVPSDVVRAIERMFPEIIKAPTSRPGLGVDVLPPFHAIVNLVEAVPAELIVLEPAQYAELIACVAALRGAVEMFGLPKTPGGFVFGLRGLELHPVAAIHRAMTACPDEAPATGTTALLFITDADLRASIRLDISAANSDLSQGEWKGATVLAGSAVEALLLWALQEHEQQHPGARQAAIAALRANNTLTQNPPGNPVDWGLHQYIEVAANLGIIEPETTTQARQAKDFRNLIHPGKAQRQAQKCDRGTALAALAAVQFVVRDLTPP